MSAEFLIIGLTIVIGFVATLIFEKTKISQVILLLIFGFVLGPLTGYLDVSPNSVMVSILPFISGIALIVLLFDGGIQFNIFSLAKAIPRSAIYSLIVFFMTLFLVSILCVMFLGWPIEYGALLGAVIGGTSSAVVIAMIERTGATKTTQERLTIESTLTDALCIITAVIILQLISAGAAPEAGTVFSLFLSSFTIAIALGTAAAMIWIALINRFSLHKYSYMMMLALLFMTFSVTETVRGNGGIAVFVFGIILGNAPRIGKFANVNWDNPLSKTAKLFQEEMTFFVRTFFFVYIGLLISLEYFTLGIILVTLVIIILIGAIRLIGQRLILPDLNRRDAAITVSTMPRGLAAAVLATMPLNMGLRIPDFQELVFSTILFTNVITTLGIYLFDRGENGEKPAEEKKIEKELLQEKPPKEAKKEEAKPEKEQMKEPAQKKEPRSRKKRTEEKSAG